MNNIDKIKDKLVKLIRLSEDDAVRDGEIENALAKAEQIMAKHNLTREDIDMDADSPCEKMEFGRCRSFTYGKNKTLWECELAWVVCDMYKTVQHYCSRTTKMGETAPRAAFYFYGPSDDAEGAAELFEELSMAIAMMATTRYGGFARKEGGTYAEGFVAGLKDAQNRQAEKAREGDNYALMVLSDERALVVAEESSNWLAKSQGIKLRSGGGMTGSSGSSGAYGQGRSDGQNYGVTKPTVRKKLA